MALVILISVKYTEHEQKDYPKYVKHAPSAWKIDDAERVNTKDAWLIFWEAPDWNRDPIVVCPTMKTKTVVNFQSQLY